MSASYVVWGVLVLVVFGVLASSAHVLMRSKPALGVWRYRLRRLLHLREDTTDLAVKPRLVQPDAPVS